MLLYLLYLPKSVFIISQRKKKPKRICWESHAYFIVYVSLSGARGAVESVKRPSVFNFPFLLLALCTQRFSFFLPLLPHIFFNAWYEYSSLTDMCVLAQWAACKRSWEISVDPILKSSSIVVYDFISYMRFIARKRNHFDLLNALRGFFSCMTFENSL